MHVHIYLCQMLVGYFTNFISLNPQNSSLRWKLLDASEACQLWNHGKTVVARGFSLTWGRGVRRGDK